MVKGVVSQVIGPVVDVVFEVPEEQMPTLHDALDLTRQDGSHLILEVQQHIGDKTVRTIAMDSTDGLSRGMEVVATGSSITMPGGDALRGRLLNVIGDTIDGLRKLEGKNQTPTKSGLGQCGIIHEARSNFCFAPTWKRRLSPPAKGRLST